MNLEETLDARLSRRCILNITLYKITRHPAA